MSRLYDTVEPSVVDEDMLQNAVEEQGPKGEAGKIAKDEGIDFGDVKALRLDFKNILKIDNLWCFTQLVKLQLDNNIIEKIEGLDVLRNLIWLDLSFNNIEVIEGLEKLVNLEDLTLHNNRIQKIENMDSLVKLHIFSIGNNDIKDLENIVYLRRFKKLLTINLTGNPISQLNEYKSFVIAHLPSLDYLDYRLIDKDMKKHAYDKYEMTLQGIEDVEHKQEKREEEKALKKIEVELQKSAYVENLNGPHLFETMYSEDAEGQKLNDMPGIEELLLSYKERFTSISVQIYEYGLKKQEERKCDVAMFWECLEDAKKDNKELGTHKINNFLDYKKKVWQDISQISDSKVLEDKMTEYNQKVSELWDGLMTLEMQLVDQLEDAIKDFERNMGDMVSAFTEQVQGLVAQCRELENQHHEKLQEIAITTLEKVVKGELEEEITDDLRELLVDKDTILNAVTSSHDVHLLKIDNKEDDIVTRINQWMSSMIEQIHENEEVSRNRARVIEINNLIDHLREEMDNLDFQGGNY